jgi:hypothetical protein
LYRSTTVDGSTATAIHTVVSAAAFVRAGASIWTCNVSVRSSTCLRSCVACLAEEEVTISWLTRLVTSVLFHVDFQQVPNISRSEYTLLDINEEGFVSNKITVTALAAAVAVQQQWQQYTQRQCHCSTQHGSAVEVAGLREFGQEQLGGSGIGW